MGNVCGTARAAAEAVSVLHIEPLRRVAPPSQARCRNARRVGWKHWESSFFESSLCLVAIAGPHARVRATIDDECGPLIAMRWGSSLPCVRWCGGSTRQACQWRKLFAAPLHRITSSAESRIAQGSGSCRPAAPGGTDCRVVDCSPRMAAVSSMQSLVC
jgi:hypothetical protein